MKTVVKVRFGSHVYGTNLPTSDIDFKAIHIPDADDILLQRAKASIVSITNQSKTERNTSADIDIESFSLQKFMSLLLEGQTSALDMFFAPSVWIEEVSPLWREIVEQKEHWLSSGVSSFVGYCRQQAAKYGIRGGRVAAVRAVIELIDEQIARHEQTARLKEDWEPFAQFAIAHEHSEILTAIHNVDGREVPSTYIEVCGRKIQDHMTLKQARQVFQLVFDGYGQRALKAERNEGVDWKALMHAVRICGEAEELLLDHTITFPRPDVELLLQIRKGSLPYARVAEIIEAGMERLEECRKRSTLPEEPDHARAEKLVLGAYRNAVRSC